MLVKLNALLKITATGGNLSEYGSLVIADDTNADKTTLFADGSANFAGNISGFMIKQKMNFLV